MIFCKLFGNLQFLPHISRKIFVRWLPFFTDWVLKDYPCQFFGKLLFCFSGKLCHIGKVNACPLTDRNRKCFTGSIYRSYRFCPADCPFGKNIRFPFQFSLIIQKFQRSQKTIAAVLAKCPLIGITAKQTIFCCKGIVFFIEFSLQLCDLFIASLFHLALDQFIRNITDLHHPFDTFRCHCRKFHPVHHRVFPVIHFLIDHRKAEILYFRVCWNGHHIFFQFGIGKFQFRNGTMYMLYSFL